MATTSPGMIGGTYAVAFERRLDNVVDTGPVFAAGEGQTAIAVPVKRGWPARARALSALSGSSIRNVLSPLAHGPAVATSGDTGYFVICAAPPGRSLLATMRPWTEPELLECVVKPAAAALADLQAKGVTHRAIRPGNMFQSARNSAVVLGPAWAAPAAAFQPSWLEPPSSALCLPAGRGDGTIADDIYALGVVLLMLTLGFNPVEGVPDDVVLRQKLDEGSFAALAGTHRLPVGMSELIRGMIADEPEHRPSPALLATPAAARARRIPVRPTRRAGRPLEIGAYSAVTARSLALALQREPKLGVAALRSGAVDDWLRRSLGDTLLAGLLEESLRACDALEGVGEGGIGPVLIAHATLALNPSGPFVWRSVALWLDGFGPALDHALHHAPDHVTPLTELATGSVAESWSKRRTSGKEWVAAKLDLRGARFVIAGERATAVPLRLTYSLNPLTPCDSPLVRRFWPTRLPELLSALEAATAAPLADGQPLIDHSVAAFIIARRDEGLHGDIGRLAATLPRNDLLAQLNLVAVMQTKLLGGPLPQLCAWAVSELQTSLARFRSRSRRTRLAENLAVMAPAGQLMPIVALFANAENQQQDAEGFHAADQRLAEIATALDDLSDLDDHHTTQARRVGQDLAFGFGAIASLLAIAIAVFG